MKKYKIILVFLITLFGISLFSFNIDLVKENYLNFIDLYNEYDMDGEFKYFFDEVENLGLYRLFRNNMIGTAEFADRPTSIQTYFSRIQDNINFETYEEELAFSGFLVYLQAELSGRRMTIEMLRSMPSHAITVNKYLSGIQEDSLTYLGNVIAYSLGLIEDSPYTNIQMFPMPNAKLDYPDWYTYYNGPNELFDNLIEENKDEIEQKIYELSKTRLTGSSLEFEIDDISETYLGHLNILAREEISEVRTFFLMQSHQGLSFSILRYLIYFGIFIILFLLYKKLAKISLIGMFVFEIIYLFFLFDVSRDIITSFMLGSFIIVFVSMFAFFSLMKVFRRQIPFKERIYDSIVFISLVVLILIPSHYIYDLTQENSQSFKNTYFERQLIYDVIGAPHAAVNDTVDSIKSMLGEEFSEIRSLYSSRLRRFLSLSVENKIIESIYADEFETEVITNRDGLKINNKDAYMRLTSDYADRIRRDMRAAEFRQTRIENQIKNLKTLIDGIFIFSDEDFRMKFQNEFNKFYRQSDLFAVYENDLNIYKNSIPMRENIPIRLHNSGYGTKIISVFLLSIFIFVIFEEKKYKLISLLVMLISSILSIIKPQYLDIVAEVRYPLILSENYSNNYLVGLFMLLITIVLFIKDFKKEGVNE